MTNIVDPVQAFLETASTTGPHPLPTVYPDLPEFQKVHHDGKLTLWVVFVVMIVASIVFTGMSWTVPVSKRLFHVITTLITIIATISYFGMASGHGVAWHHIKQEAHHDVYRQVFWARYVDWALTTPLLLLDLFLLAGANGATIFMGVTADVIMILTGLFAAFGGEKTGQKWGWYAISCIAFLVVLWHLILGGRAAAMARGAKLGNFYTSIMGYTVVIWIAYPIIWGVTEGGRHLGVDGEIIAYAVLDILAKPIFGLWLLITHSRMPEASVELNGFWSQGLTGEGRIRIGDDDDGA